MHKFTVSDVSKEDFDFSLLSPSDDYWANICDKIDKSVNNHLLELKNMKDYHGRLYYDGYTDLELRRHINPHNVVSNLQLKNEEYLCMLFSEGYLDRLSEEIHKRYMFEGSLNQQWIKNSLFYPVYNFINNHFIIANKAFKHSKSNDLKSWLITNNFVEQKEIEAIISSKEILNYSQAAQQAVINLFGSSEAELFSTSNHEDIRLEAYKKIGLINSIDRMLKDKSAMIRCHAAKSMRLGDPRFKALANEKAKTVFSVVIRKAPIDIFPLLIGNKNLKDNYIKLEFKKRMEDKN